MSLISFPISPNNIKEKVYFEAPVTSYNPTGSTGFKAEYSYTVPLNRNSIITPSFSLTIGQYRTSSPFDTIAFAASVSITDFLKAGDVVYSGVRVWTQNNSPNQNFYEFFFQVNSITIYEKTGANIGGNGAYSYPKINHTIYSLQVDK